MQDSQDGSKLEEAEVAEDQNDFIENEIYRFILSGNNLF